MHTIEVTHLKSLKDKSVGLLGAKVARPVYFTTRWGIHTYGVQFPIDVLILDNKNIVVKLAQSLKPNTMFIWNPKYFRVVELPAGNIEKYGIKKGDPVLLKLT